MNQTTHHHHHHHHDDSEGLADVISAILMALADRIAAEDDTPVTIIDDATLQQLVSDEPHIFVEFIE